jgi:predicted ATPase
MRKIVITGGPSSGKTTLIDRLGKKNYVILGEVARKFFNEVEKMPETPEEWLIVEREILRRQLQQESELNRLDPSLAFLDRGVEDMLAYCCHTMGYLPREFENIQTDYYHVFSLERLPFIDDGLRIESGDEEAQQIHETIIQTYQERNYDLSHVPIFPGKTLRDAVDKRIEFILGELDDRN